MNDGQFQLTIHKRYIPLNEGGYSVWFHLSVIRANTINAINRHFPSLQYTGMAHYKEYLRSEIQELRSRFNIIKISSKSSVDSESLPAAEIALSPIGYRLELFTPINNSAFWIGTRTYGTFAECLEMTKLHHNVIRISVNENPPVDHTLDDDSIVQLVLTYS